MSETDEAVGRVQGTLDSGDRMGGFHASDDTGNTVRRGDLRTLLAALATAHGDVKRLIALNDETTQEWRESVERLLEERDAARHELALSESMRTQALDDLAFADERALATLRERLAGEVGALKMPVPVTHFDGCARLIYGDSAECDCRYLSNQASNVHYNAALDRAVAVIRGEHG